MSDSVPQFVPGWAEHIEDHDFLGGLMAPVVPRSFARPEEVSHRNWFRVRNQGSVGSCTGFMRAGIGQILNHIETAGREDKQLSAMWAYLTNQKRCGLFGRDVGATITSAMKASDLDGEVLESSFPYPGRYTTTMPAACAAEGDKHQVKAHARPRSVDEILEALASGLWVLGIGVGWTDTLRAGGVRVDDAGRHSAGGHAMVVPGYSSRYTDRAGLPYFELLNSHGTGWGDGGWKWVAPKVVSQWLQDDYCELILFSDIEEGWDQVDRSHVWDLGW